MREFYEKSYSTTLLCAALLHQPIGASLLLFQCEDTTHSHLNKCQSGIHQSHEAEMRNLENVKMSVINDCFLIIHSEGLKFPNLKKLSLNTKLQLLPQSYQYHQGISYVLQDDSLKTYNFLFYNKQISIKLKFSLT